MALCKKECLLRVSTIVSTTEGSSFQFGGGFYCGVRVFSLCLGSRWSFLTWSKDMHLGDGWISNWNLTSGVNVSWNGYQPCNELLTSSVSILILVMSELYTLAIHKYASSYEHHTLMRKFSMAFSVVLLFTMFLFRMEHYSMCTLLWGFFFSLFF